MVSRTEKMVTSDTIFVHLIVVGLNIILVLSFFSTNNHIHLKLRRLM